MWILTRTLVRAISCFTWNIKFCEKTQEFMKNPFKIAIITRGQTEKSAFLYCFYVSRETKECEVGMNRCYRIMKSRFAPWIGLRHESNCNHQMPSGNSCDLSQFMTRRVNSRNGVAIHCKHACTCFTWNNGHIEVLFATTTRKIKIGGWSRAYPLFC